MQEPRGEEGAPEAEEEADSFLVEGGPVAGSTVRFDPGAEPYLKAPLPPEARGARVARDLRALLRIGHDLHALRSPEPLARRLLELVIEALPAERSALLLLDARTGGLTFTHALNEEGGTDPFPVSRTLMDRVVAERAAVLANDVLQPGGAWGGVESVASSYIQSLAAVPLAGPDGILGVLYADTRHPGGRFDAANVDLLTAAAGIAATALANLRHLEALRAEKQRIEASLDSGMIGESPRMKEVSRFLARVAPTNSTVLLRGESGTGKEVAARAIHRASPRAGGPFVAINCAALTETLLESELFGHEKGAFTGANARKAGKIEVADGGTLFLDEVGELPPGVQAKLLRVLQEREFERVGGTRPLRVDVRVIAATNRDLERAIREGTFREDLFYRLNVLSVVLPPLRERREDIPRLAGHFAAQSSRQARRRISGLSPEARACLLRYDWPGNVRELANAMERAAVLGDGELIRPEDLPEAVLETAPAGGGAPVGAYHQSVNAYKKSLILDAVAQAGGNVARAAEALELNPTYLHRLIRNLDLKGLIRL